MQMDFGKYYTIATFQQACECGMIMKLQYYRIEAAFDIERIFGIVLDALMYIKNLQYNLNEQYVRDMMQS